MNATITNISYGKVASRGRSAFGRTIHLIDIENLCGSSRVTPDQVAEARERYEEAIPIVRSDQVIVASSTGNRPSSRLGWPGARLLARDGKNGADDCLAEVIAGGLVTKLFDRAVVASGDGGLAPSVAFMAGEGIYTVVVSQSDRLSRSMRVAAHKSILLEPKLQERA
jgi:hypothetical protein